MFYLHDAMLVWVPAVIWPCVCVRVCLSVCLSVTSQSSINTDERIEVVFGMEASYDLSYAVL